MEEVEQQKVNKKVLYSAVQPTNALTIGNYIGAIRNMVAMQDNIITKVPIQVAASKTKYMSLDSIYIQAARDTGTGMGD